MKSVVILTIFLACCFLTYLFWNYPKAALIFAIGSAWWFGIYVYLDWEELQIRKRRISKSLGNGVDSYGKEQQQAR